MKIKIDNIPTNERRAAYFDDSPFVDFYINESELQEIIQLSRFEDWHNNPEKGMLFGRQLFNLLNRNNGKLQQALDRLTLDKPLDLLLYLPRDLSNIPFELLYYNEFITLKTNVSILRMVSEKSGQLEVKDRALKVLFVATSAVEHEASTLNFEQEEEKIIEATKKYPVDFQVEDTGSLEGIETMLWELKGVDILHISGHAGHDMGLGPVFYMEDKVGKLDKVTPEKLFQAIKDICPSVLFLSGCSTGKRDNFTDSESLAFRMAQLGVPIVLSWGLPVSDSGATRFASVFYEKVAKGLPIYRAVNEAQLLFREDFHPWPLMRLFSSGAKPGNLVTQGIKVDKFSRKPIHKGFIGRRRDLQKANAVLRNTDKFKDKYGIIIRGPAGVGKSSLADHVLERQTSYNVINFRGELTENIIFYHLTRYFDRKGTKTALEILKREEEYEEKVKDLYREVFSENKVILYFDDFEQNLKSENDTWYLENKSLNAFMPFLEFIDYAENQSKVVIASNYIFELFAAGVNLVNKLLVDIPLNSLPKRISKIK